MRGEVLWERMRTCRSGLLKGAGKEPAGERAFIILRMWLPCSYMLEM